MASARAGAGLAAGAEYGDSGVLLCRGSGDLERAQAYSRATLVDEDDSVHSSDALGLILLPRSQWWMSFLPSGTERSAEFTTFVSGFDKLYQLGFVGLALLGSVPHLPPLGRGELLSTPMQVADSGLLARCVGGDTAFCAGWPDVRRCGAGIRILFCECGRPSVVARQLYFVCKLPRSHCDGHEKL